MFIANKKRLAKFIDYLEPNDLDISYNISLRADLVDAELCIMLKQSGCKFVNVGFESMDSTVLQELNKRVTPEQNEQAAKLLKKHKIQFGINFIWGAPSDNAGTLEQSVKFIKKWKLPYFDYSKSGEVEQPMSCALLIKKEVFKEIGLFDERFFLYFSDVDFSKRLLGKFLLQVF